MGGQLEGKFGLRGAVPWGMGQSLWALVNKSGNKKNRWDLEKPSALLLTKLAQASSERRGGVSFLFLSHFFVLFCFVFVSLSFLGPRPQHMEVSRLGVESEL